MRSIARVISGVYTFQVINEFFIKVEKFVKRRSNLKSKFLRAILKKYKISVADAKKVLLYLEGNLEEIVVSEDYYEIFSKSLEAEKKKFNKVIDLKTGEDIWDILISKILCYSSFSSNVYFRSFAHKAGIKICPYCGSNFTRTFKVDSKSERDFQMDHFVPKTIHPLFSLSIFNLIPVCSICNKRKSNKFVPSEMEFHPFRHNSLTAKFSYGLNNYWLVKEYIGINVRKEQQSLEVYYSDPSVSIVKDMVKNLRLKHVYQFHTQLINDILHRKRLFTQEYLSHLIKLRYEASSAVELERLDYDLRKLLFHISTANESENTSIHYKFIHDILCDLKVKHYSKKEYFKPDLV